MPFLGYKNNKFKKSKNWHFFKVVNPWIFSKYDHFSNFFFRQYRSRKCLLWHSRTKSCLSWLQKQEVQKVENLKFFNFSPKMAFVQFFFLGNIDPENVFYDILERKIDFLGYKNKKFKKSKNWHFPHGVNPRFWSKNAHFLNFFF